MDFSTQVLRDSTILTTSYVGGKVIGDFRDPSDTSPCLQKENQINLMFDLTKGSIDSLEFKLEGAYEFLFDLAYDGQTGNFALGETVTGATSNASGIVVEDTDAGASGTLVIRMRNSGKDATGFYDNEVLTGSASGVAVVNGALNFQTASISESSFFQETSSSWTSGTDTLSLGSHTIAAAGLAARDRFLFALSSKYPYYRVSFKGTGTMTSSLLQVTAMVGQV